MANPSDSDGTASPPHTVHWVGEAASESCGFGGKWDESLILITVIIINIILLQMARCRLLPFNCWSVEGSEMQWLSSHPSQTSLSCRCVCHPVNCRKKRGGDTNTMEETLQSTQQRKRKRWLINCQRNWQRTKKYQICVELFSLSTVWSLDMKCDYRRWKGDQWVWQQPTMSPLLKPSMPSTATMPYKRTKRLPIKTGSMPCH